jgi:tRNA pseudouridine38-40 synthase
MPTYRLTLEYEGTRYHGWQEQKNARSVAGELRRAIEESGAVVRELGGSGRTDAGVHALAQVAHLRLTRQVDPEPFRRALNDRLPPDVHVLSLAAAADRFHSRHDAVSRSYLYQISRRRTALAKRFVWWVKRPLDAGRMAAAAALLAGRHDFRLFCERPAEQPSTLVVVEKAEVTTAGALILVRLSASHFLWKMVRRVVGTLVELGAGDLDRRAFEELLAARAPKPGKGLPAEWTAPPSGLFLERVLYEGDSPLGPVAPAFPVAVE